MVMFRRNSETKWFLFQLCISALLNFSCQDAKLKVGTTGGQTSSSRLGDKPEVSGTILTNDSTPTWSWTGTAKGKKVWDVMVLRPLHLLLDGVQEVLLNLENL